MSPSRARTAWPIPWLTLWLPLWLTMGALVSPGLLACATTSTREAFDLGRDDNRATELSVLEPPLERSAAPPESPGVLVYGPLQSTPDRPDDTHALARFRPGQGAPAWQRSIALDARPLSTGDVVVSRRGGTLVVLDDATGGTRFTHPSPDPTLIGAVHSQGTLVVVTANDEPPARATILGLDARTGMKRFQHGVTGRLGAPVAVGRHVILPWNAQFLAVLDAASGREVARLRSRHGLFTWVRAQADGVYFGDLAIHRGLVRYLKGETHPNDPDFGLHLPTGNLPSKPPPYPSAFEPRPAGRSAHGRVGVHFELRPNPEGAPALADDQLFFVFYRHVYGLDAQGEPRWVRVLDQDVVSARAQAGGLSVVTEGGRLQHLAAADGRLVFQQALPGFAHITSARLGPLPSTPGTMDAASERPSLRQQLLAAALDEDSRLMPSREYALRHLARQPEAAVTRDLIDLYQQTNTPASMKREIARQMLTRENGAEYLLDALGQRYDFLEQSRAAPLELIVPALVQLGERRALPGLSARLFDHETQAEQLPMLVDAIATLGGSDAIPVLRRFVDLYRADSFAARTPGALLLALQALVELDAEADGTALQAHLRALSLDPRTVTPLREPLVAMLDPMPAPVVPSEPEAPAPPSERPLRLAQGEINRVFADLAEDLRACALDELGRDPELSQLRIAFVIDADGRPRTRAYVPNSADFVACIDPKVANLQFPLTQARQQLGDYTVALRSAAGPKAPPRPQPEGWWAPYAQADERPPNAQEATEPWWRDQNPLMYRVDRAFQRAPSAGAAAAKQGAAADSPLPGSGAAASQPPVPPAWYAPVGAGSGQGATPKANAGQPAGPTPASPATPSAPRRDAPSAKRDAASTSETAGATASEPKREQTREPTGEPSEPDGSEPDGTAAEPDPWWVPEAQAVEPQADG